MPSPSAIGVPALRLFCGKDSNVSLLHTPCEKTPMPEYPCGQPVGTVTRTVQRIQSCKSPVPGSPSQELPMLHILHNSFLSGRLSYTLRASTVRSSPPQPHPLSTLEKKVSIRGKFILHENSSRKQTRAEPVAGATVRCPAVDASAKPNGHVKDLSHIGVFLSILPK